MALKRFISGILGLVLSGIGITELKAQQSDILYRKIAGPGAWYQSNAVHSFLGDPISWTSGYPKSGLAASTIHLDSLAVIKSTSPAYLTLVRNSASRPDQSVTPAGQLLRGINTPSAGAAGVFAALKNPVASSLGVTQPGLASVPSVAGSAATNAISKVIAQDKSLAGTLSGILNKSPGSAAASPASLLAGVKPPSSTPTVPGMNNSPVTAIVGAVSQPDKSLAGILSGIVKTAGAANPAATANPAQTYALATNPLNQLTAGAVTPTGAGALNNLTAPGAGAATGLAGVDPARALNVRSALTSQAVTNFKPMNDAIGENFKTMPKSSFAANLSLENDLQYNPIRLIPNGSKFQEVLGVRGTLLVMGVPLNLSVSNNQAAFNGQNPFGSSLYKFGFNPAMFSGMLHNELQQYTNLKNSVFHGFNFTDYVKQTITEQVHSLDAEAAGLKNSNFSHLLQDPEKLQQMMVLSEGQLKTKLHAMALEQDKTAADSTGKLGTLTEAEKQVNLKKADSLAQVITSIKKQLKANGLDPAKLILDENYLSGKTSPGFNSSESALNLFEKKTG